MTVRVGGGKEGGVCGDPKTGGGERGGFEE